MLRFRLALLAMLLCMARPALADGRDFEDPGYDADRPTALLALGLRIDFGAAERRPAASLALRTTREFIDRQVGLPLLAVDFGTAGTALGTVMGIRVNPQALRHQVQVLRKPRR